MRVDVAVTPAGLDGAALAGRTALVGDVLRASTSIIAALAAGAAAVGVGALANLGAAAGWAAGDGHDVAIVCAGRRGAPAPEDQVAAGLRVARLAAAVGGEVTVAARRALAVARPYAGHLDRLARDSAWARRLAGQGWQADVRAWLALDRVGLVPVYRPDVDKIVVGSR